MGEAEMKAAGYMGQPYQTAYPGQAAAPVRITKRPITDMERNFAAGAYKTFQKSVRVIAIVPLALFFINYFLISRDPDLFIMSFIFGLLNIIIAFVAIGMAISLLVTRNKVSQIMAGGSVIEVQGNAIRGRTSRNMPSFNVGPVSIFVTPEVSRLVVEGAQVSVVCIPQLKAALSINNAGLSKGARITCPPNLEMMALQGSQPMQQMQQPMIAAQQAAPQYYPQAGPQAAPAQPSYQQYAPAMGRCPNCGQLVQPHWQNCAFCNAKLK
jgi:hypothetical protein